VKANYWREKEKNDIGVAFDEIQVSGFFSPDGPPFVACTIFHFDLNSSVLLRAVVLI
jgi:hypothetical protein